MIETKKSFCRFCHAFCGTEVDVEEGRVVAVRGDKENPASQGYTCLKGRAEMERMYHPQRLLASPQVVRDGRGGFVSRPISRSRRQMQRRLKQIRSRIHQRRILLTVLVTIPVVESR